MTSADPTREQLVQWVQTWKDRALAAEANAQRVRAEALERCAVVCDRYKDAYAQRDNSVVDECAAAIRALAQQEDTD